MSDPPTILIVDDDHDFVEAVGTCLEAEGYRVLRAYDAGEGLKVAKRERPDLIIMDIMMTERTEGFFGVQAIRSSPALRETPVFVVSSLYSHVPDFEVAPERGWLPYDEFLSKPVKPVELLSRIRQYLSAGRGRKALTGEEEQLP